MLFLPLIILETSPLIGLLVFIALFVFVIQNRDISRFIRFNVLQAILLSIFLYVGLVVLGLPGLGGILGATLINVLFIGGLAAVIYAMVQSVLGQYTGNSRKLGSPVPLVQGGKAGERL